MMSCPVRRETGHATEFTSTYIAHSASSHSGTYTRCRLCWHQRFRSGEATSCDLVNPNRATSASNSVGRTRARLSLNQSGLPRARFFGGRLGAFMATDHTLLIGVEHVWASNSARTRSKNIIDSLTWSWFSREFLPAAAALCRNIRSVHVDVAEVKVAIPCHAAVRSTRNYGLTATFLLRRFIGEPQRAASHGDGFYPRKNWECEASC